MKNFNQEILLLLNLYKNKNLIKAELLAKRLINIYPNNILLYNILGLTLADQKKVEEAISCYENGLKIDSNYAMIHNNLGTLYKATGDYKKAEMYLKRSIELDGALYEPKNNLANLYKENSKYKEAINLYKNVLDKNPEYFPTLFNLAILYKGIGSLEKAQNYFEKAIKINPQFYPAHRSLSLVKKYNSNDKHLDELIRLSVDNKTSTSNKTELFFALGKAYEDCKNYKESFKFYTKGNNIRRKSFIFSINKVEKSFNKIINFYNKENFNKFKYSGNLSKKPIFIVGMPRSGTTLIEQIISSHSQVFGADELNFLPQLVEKNIKEFKNVNNGLIKNIGDNYINKIKILSDKSKNITDKHPINFKNIGIIKLALPNAKIIHCTRNSKDTCLSIFKNYFTSTQLNFAYNIDEIVKYYNLYKVLMKHWNNNLPGFIHEINYETLIKNPEIQVKNILKFCNLDWDNKCLEFHKNDRFIKTASDIQVRKRIYSSSVKSWEKYKDFTAEVLAQLSP